jgi:hypothetical protein
MTVTLASGSFIHLQRWREPGWIAYREMLRLPGDGFHFGFHGIAALPGGNRTATPTMSNHIKTTNFPHVVS